MLLCVFSLFSLLSAEFGDIFKNPGFDNYNPFDTPSKEGDSSKEKSNPWADKFSGVWNNKDDAGDKFKQGPSLEELAKSGNQLPLKELWETTKNPYSKKKPEGYNFKVPDEFNKPIDQMGRQEIKLPENFGKNPFAPKPKAEKKEEECPKEDPCAPKEEKCAPPKEEPCQPEPTPCAPSPQTARNKIPPRQNRNRFFDENCGRGSKAPSMRNLCSRPCVCC
ncbi:uncharacterized protein MONOS_1332 [Monocercomonoides exilis]|uniref:uncharacterized protein n=1 Tax=Monocercomonoides exilis TaxID=2049356 RepID=UPI003559B5B4|nr:hypothetical protein MONOS_1332 [Monocercomonoides exilis]|eukprot:MONOS_1332.1-p1 / transcript=MONOS_1332.1 / gene=MONOS_1332 / organism=Monocercomonoides_exilis_PA203 / gene_product=unspecified product / transcript_product=unspecified product / location=Mono_scaffold00023:24671-25388(+) / protein_length=221 / sequence_SO=supercontig / SO=protein_coding / is_pseudo=false